MKRLFKVGSERHDVGKVTFAWQSEGSFLASAGRNGIVHITDRHGDIIDEIPMTTSEPIISLSWDKDGSHLAILQEGNGVVPLWSLSTKRVSPIETNLKDPSFLAWSNTGPQLAIGTVKGNVLIYNAQKKKKIPIVGKHSKKITCGAWSSTGNKLVLGSDDHTLTISNESGDTLLHTELKYTPLQTLFTTSKSSVGGGRNDDNIVSANLNGKSLLIYNIFDEKEDPIELTFATKASGAGCRYGDIVSHHWLEENLVIIAFSLGYVVSVSTQDNGSLGEEKNAIRLHQTALYNFAYNPVTKKSASAGDDGVRVIDTRDFVESQRDFIPYEDLENGKISNLAWSPDGQILSIGTQSGNVYNFLAKMSVLNAVNRSAVCYLSSLREVSVVECARRTRPIDVPLRQEPSLLALGSMHIAAGMNGRVHYHRIVASGNDTGVPINEQEYVGVVREVQLNAAYAVVLTDSKAILHSIEPSVDGQSQVMTLPSREEGSMAKVTAIALTDEFLYYGTEAGTVEVFFLAEWKLLSGSELRLEPARAIKKLYPNAAGTRLVVMDASYGCYLFNPVTGGGINQSLTTFDKVPQVVVSVIWDVVDRNVIMIFDGRSIHSYVYVPTSIKGSMIVKLGPVSVSTEGEIMLEADQTDLAVGMLPLLSAGGTLTCQTSSGTLSTITHPFFDKLDAGPELNSPSKDRGKEGARSPQWNKETIKVLSDKFCQAVALLKLETAWEVALEIDRRQFWLALSNKAMELMNVELASRVYRQLGDAGMVMALEKCRDIEDRSLLAGQISMLFGEYGRAQELFLSSSRPSAALAMRRDLLQWDQALKLAEVLANDQIPDICARYAQQLEFRDENDRALKLYESAMSSLGSQDYESHLGPEEELAAAQLMQSAKMGIARCQLRLGNNRAGIRLANELDEQPLYCDCGEILEQQKQYSEAASMYLKGLQYEKAASIYTRFLIKNDKSRIPEAAQILAKVDNDTLNSNFAKACVAAGKYEDAVQAYERAKDMDKVVELQLRYLDKVQQAFDLVRTAPSAQGAQCIADYCEETGDFRGAVEFLLLAGKSDEAFKLSQSHGIVEAFTNHLGENISSDDAMRVASFYEKSGNDGQAGKFYAKCRQYARALKLFIKCGDREIDAAIEVVGKSQNESLIHQLIDFLVGEKDGMPKDQQYIYRLYLALKKYEDAAKTCLMIARSEQEAGNYPLAHSVIMETIRELETANVNVPLQLRQAFTIIHSYTLVKTLAKAGNHTGAARLLLRVAQHVSKFPAHVVQILTSTVIECQRAGLKASSYEHSVTLMRPEYRALIDPNLKRKIEAIVRRRYAQGEEQGDSMSICPISADQIPEYMLECPSTRDAIPMCALTGKHMLLEDWCFCPNSKLPALYSEYVNYIEGGLRNQTTDEAEKRLRSGEDTLSVPDPVTGQSVTIAEVLKVEAAEATKYIKRYNNVVEKEEERRG